MSIATSFRIAGQAVTCAGLAFPLVLLWMKVLERGHTAEADEGWAEIAGKGVVERANDYSFWLTVAAVMSVVRLVRALTIIVDRREQPLQAMWQRENWLVILLTLIALMVFVGGSMQFYLHEARQTHGTFWWEAGEGAQDLKSKDPRAFAFIETLQDVEGVLYVALLSVWMGAAALMTGATVAVRRTLDQALLEAGGRRAGEREAESAFNAAMAIPQLMIGIALLMAAAGTMLQVTGALEPVLEFLERAASELGGGSPGDGVRRALGRTFVYLTPLALMVLTLVTVAGTRLHYSLNWNPLQGFLSIRCRASR